MPTIVALTGAPYPRERNGKPIPPPEGVSLAPILGGKTIDRAAPLFWEHEGNRAVRVGDWKLLAAHGEPWQLYDVVKDRAELNDLAAGNPAKVEELKSLYEKWAARCGVEPWPVRR